MIFSFVVAKASFNVTETCFFLTISIMKIDVLFQLLATGKVLSHRRRHRRHLLAQRVRFPLRMPPSFG